MLFGNSLLACPRPRKASHPLNQTSVFYLPLTFCAVLPPSGESNCSFGSSSNSRLRGSEALLRCPETYERRVNPTLNGFFKIICLPVLNGTWASTCCPCPVTQDGGMGSERRKDTSEGIMLHFISFGYGSISQSSSPH